MSRQVFRSWHGIGLTHPSAFVVACVIHLDVHLVKEARRATVIDQRASNAFDIQGRVSGELRASTKEVALVRTAVNLRWARGEMAVDKSQPEEMWSKDASAYDYANDVKR